MILVGLCGKKEAKYQGERICLFINVISIPGPLHNIKMVFPGMGISMIKIRWSRDRLIMGILILARRHLYIETAPNT